jgi:hypothetical protein
MEKSRNAFAVKQVHGARQPEVDGAISAAGTGAAMRDQSAQPAKKVWSGFGQVLENEACGANESGSASTW